MAVHERNRAVRLYHSVVSILLLLSGGGLLAAGIWLRVTDNAGPLNLEYSGSSVFNWVLNFSTGVMVIGVFLLIAAFASLLALGRKCIGGTFRAIYVIMALIILAALVFICVVSIIILTNRDTDTVRDFLSRAWDRTVRKEPTEVCSIEKHYECRGFRNNDCLGCELGSELGCVNPACANCGVRRNAKVGCYQEIINSVRKFYLPVSIASAVLALVVLIDIIVACAL